MHSSLYRGLVRHTRYKPRRHDFRYRMFQFYLDLDELPGVLDRLWFCSSRRPAPVRFRRRDHLGPRELPLKEAVRRKVVELGGPRLDGRVRLLTNLRYFGYGFNPVSFYYCYGVDGVTLEAIVAEINNTPWGEQHCYVLPASASAGTARKLRFRFGKDFHVSPFLPMDMDYDWRFTLPDDRLLVHMENWREDRLAFDATMTLEREPLSSPALTRALVAYPFMTGKVAGAIYWQALRLWLKRAPFFTHPDKTGAGHRTRRGRIEGTVS